MSGRQFAGAAILAAVFVGFFVAFGLTLGWLGTSIAFGGGMALGCVTAYGASLLAG